MVVVLIGRTRCLVLRPGWKGLVKMGTELIESGREDDLKAMVEMESLELG